jgi:hypothetical protein
LRHVGGQVPQSLGGFPLVGPVAERPSRRERLQVLDNPSTVAPPVPVRPAVVGDAASGRTSRARLPEASLSDPNTALHRSPAKHKNPIANALRARGKRSPHPHPLARQTSFVGALVSPRPTQAG